jgi:hypothetical protein
LANDARVMKRGELALEKLRHGQMQTENERNLHLLHRLVLCAIVFTFFSSNRKAALELEKVLSQHIAGLPLATDPLRDLQLKSSQCSFESGRDMIC